MSVDVKRFGPQCNKPGPQFYFPYAICPLYCKIDGGDHMELQDAVLLVTVLRVHSWLSMET